MSEPVYGRPKWFFTTHFGGDLMGVGNLADVNIVLPADLVLRNDDLARSAISSVGNRVAHDANRANHFSSCGIKDIL